MQRGKWRFRIVKHRVGLKGARWRQKAVWHRAEANILRDWKRMLENQPAVEEVVAALKEAGKPGPVNYATIGALEKKIVKQWRALNKLRDNLAECIRNGPMVGEGVGSLKIKMGQIEGANGFIPMVNALLGELITLWANQPETKATIAHIKALQELRRNPNPKAKKKRKPRSKHRRKKRK